MVMCIQAYSEHLAHCGGQWWLHCMDIWSVRRWILRCSDVALWYEFAAIMSSGKIIFEIGIIFFDAFFIITSSSSSPFHNNYFSTFFSSDLLLFYHHDSCQTTRQNEKAQKGPNSRRNALGWRDCRWERWDFVSTVEKEEEHWRRSNPLRRD
jgi:hypothetical protein